MPSLPARGQHRRVDPAHPVAEMGQWHELVGIGVVDQDGMALAEGAPPGVLPGQAHVDALGSREPMASASARAQST